jgi:hypothetical protein
VKKGTPHCCLQWWGRRKATSLPMLFWVEHARCGARRFLRGIFPNPHLGCASSVVKSPSLQREARDDSGMRSWSSVARQSLKKDCSSVGRGRPVGPLKGLDCPIASTWDWGSELADVSAGRKGCRSQQTIWA